MSEQATTLTSPDFAAAAQQINDAATAKKCWQCGCLHSSLRAIAETFPAEHLPAELAGVIAVARSRLQPVRYDCLGCEVCFPALAINALGVEGDACPGEPATLRAGWPPLAGAYRVLRYQAPVAVCTLTDEKLADAVSGSADKVVAVVGTMQTENLGIERLIQNTLANPHLRFVVLCGADSRQTIGHLPGQSLLALARAGVDERMRIKEASGKRPVLRNLNRETVDHFRRTVQVVDLIGETDISRVLATARDCAATDPGPAEPFAGVRAVPVVQGQLPSRMVSDPSGYFVVFPDATRGRLTLEHYSNDGLLDVVIEGASAAEVYLPAIERGLLSRLDHAAYLGKELTRAERCLRHGEPYVQDAAPELRSQAPATENQSAQPHSCGCGSSSCGENKR